MPAESIRAATEADWPAIALLLTDAGLPLAGAREHLPSFIVAECDGALTGCAGMERYGQAALLRSVAVRPALRGHRLGERLVKALIDAAGEEKVQIVALLTTTAESWFPRFGFRRVERSELPTTLEASAELRGACPSTAVAMLLHLRR